MCFKHTRWDLIHFKVTTITLHRYAPLTQNYQTIIADAHIYLYLSCKSIVIAKLDCANAGKHFQPCRVWIIPEIPRTSSTVERCCPIRSFFKPHWNVWHLPKCQLNYQTMALISHLLLQFHGPMSFHIVSLQRGHKNLKTASLHRIPRRAYAVAGDVTVCTRVCNHEANWTDHVGLEAVKYWTTLTWAPTESEHMLSELWKWEKWHVWQNTSYCISIMSDDSTLHFFQCHYIFV